MKGSTLMFRYYSKRLISLILVSVMSFLTTISLTVDIGGVHSFLNWFAYDFAYSTEKISPFDVLGRDAKGEIYLAKNEREAVQIAVHARYGTEDATLTFSEFKNDKGDVLKSNVYFEQYTVVGEESDYFFGNYPDALIPYETKEMEYSWHKNNVFYIEVESDKNTPAGTYRATATLTNSEKTFFTAEIVATVWDFTMPETPATQTAMGIFSGNFYTLNGVDGSNYYGVNGGARDAIEGAQLEVYKKYYDFLLDHGVSAYSLPYDILDERADAYMSDPRVTSFIIPYPDDDTLLVKYHEKLKKNPEWLKKGMFYPIDEPHSISMVNTYNQMTQRLAKLCPGYNMITPFYGIEIEDSDGSGAKIKNFDVQAGKSNNLCPESICYSDKNFVKKMNERKNLGDKAWWYVCCGPDDKSGYCNMFMFQPGIKHRMLFWQEKQYDVTGFLYWDTCYWEKAENPWINSKTWDNTGSSGDGCLIYPGKYVGVDGPVATVRLKGVANGIEDYTLLTMAEKVMGEKWVDKEISKVSKNLTNYTLNDKKFNDVRVEIGKALSEKF